MTFVNTGNLYDKYSGVVELTTRDFTIKNNEITLKKPFKKNGLIVFYSPWCEHCIKSSEMWSELAIQFNYKFIIATVNCENRKNELIRLKSNIEYYPTVKYLKSDGKIYNLEHKLNTKDEIIYFICNHLVE